MVKQLPKFIFLLNRYGIFVFGIAAVVIAWIITAGNGIDGFDILLLLFIIGGFVALWLSLRPSQSKDIPIASSPEAVLQQVTSANKFTLIAFESSFCPICMATDSRVATLEENPPANLAIKRLIIQQDPGKTLFEKYDGRMTPTYMLFNQQGKQVMEWTLVLPIERVLYTINQTPA